MAEPSTPPDEHTSKPRIAWKKTVRRYLRPLHRDFGYLIVGLTFVYAISGLAVNHIDDWNANYVTYTKTHQLGTLPNNAQRATQQILTRLQIKDKPSDSFRTAKDELELTFKNKTLVATLSTGQVEERGRDARFFVKAANWLHLNRGKKAWTYIADGYAVLLLFLALSGAFMLPGRKGLLGRGGILILLGAAVPTLYVLFAQGSP